MRGGMTKNPIFTFESKRVGLVPLKGEDRGKTTYYSTKDHEHP